MVNLTNTDVDADKRNLENHSLHHVDSQLLQRDDAKGSFTLSERITSCDSKFADN